MPPTALPPGSSGLPGLGETLAFTRDPFAFVQQRRSRYGRVFRTHLLGRKTVVLIGPEPLRAFYDPANVVRHGANPGNVQTLFGGDGVINNLDGTPHARRRAAVKAALSRDAIESYVPVMKRFVDAAFERWCSAGETALNEELERLVIETLGAAFASLESPGELAALVARCERIAAAFTALPVPLPGTPYAAGVRAKDEALAYYRSVVRAHRARAHDDGLARMLAARDAGDDALSDDEAAGELHHLFLAGFIVFAQLGAVVVHLSHHDEVRVALNDSLAALPDAPTVADLVGSAFLMRVVNEVRRLTPIVPVVFGKALRAFDVDGFVVPAGWGVAAAVWSNDREATSFREPERFDPDRFAARAEQDTHPFAFTPQGAGPEDGHRCPGFDLTAVFMALFAATLVRRFTWTLPPQDLALDWTRLPPVPRDGLRARVQRA